MHSFRGLAALLCLLFSLSGASAPTLGQVRRIYVESMPGGFDQVLRQEIHRQFKDKVQVVLDRHEADSILVDPNAKRPAAKPNTADLSLLDRGGKILLWTGEASDRKAMFRHGGASAMAENLVHKLKHAIESSR